MDGLETEALFELTSVDDPWKIRYLCMSRQDRSRYGKAGPIDRHVDLIEELPYDRFEVGLGGTSKLGLHHGHPQIGSGCKHREVGLCSADIAGQQHAAYSVQGREVSQQGEKQDPRSAVPLEHSE